MLCYIGNGGAGGNLADEMIKRGFHSVAINFSQKDLDSLEHIPVEHQLKLNGSEGAGHSRELAKQLLSGQMEMVVSWMKEQLSNPLYEVLAFTTSSSGGSGAAITPPLIEIAQALFPDKVVIAIPIIPDESEASTSQHNFLTTFEELSNLDIFILPIDNQQAVNHGYKSKNKIYEYTNQSFAQLITDVCSYTEKFSKFGNFDKRDFKTLLSTKGIGLISETNFTTIDGSDKHITLSESGIATLIHSSWENSIFIKPTFDYVSKSAVIYDGKDTFADLINYQEIFSSFNSGMPIDLFEGYYDNGKNTIYTVLSGLPWCSTRLNKADELILNENNKIETIHNNQINQSYQAKSSGVLTKISMPVQPVPKKSVSDLINKYKQNK